MTVREILQRLNIDTAEAGDELIIFCPRGKKGLHKPKRKLYIQPDDGVYKCFQCDGKEDPYQGHIDRLLRDLGANPKWLKKDATPNVSVDEIQKFISDLWGQDKEITGPSSIEEITLPKEYSTSWKKSAFGKLALCYLENRGLTKRRIDTYEIGFCDSGYFKGYVIIPFYEKDRLVYFQARRFFPYLSKPKYLNPLNSTFGKSDFVFRLSAVNPTLPVIITEGVFDALAVGKNGVSILGKKISDRQVSLLLEVNPVETIVLLDRDATEEAHVVARRLSLDLEKVKVGILRLSKDPGSAPLPELTTTLQEATAYDSMAGFCATLNSL